MAASFFGRVARWRVAVLAGAVPAALALEAFRDLRLVSLLSVLVPLGLVTLMTVSLRSYHPAELVVRPGALAVPVNPGAVLGAAGLTFLGVRTVGDMIRDADYFVAVLLVAWLVLQVGFAMTALGDYGVRLRPDGIVNRQLNGTLFVPWAALAGAEAYSSQQVALIVTRPELARGRGLRRGSPTMLPATAVDAGLLAGEINRYVKHPGLRGTIGGELVLKE